MTRPLFGPPASDARRRAAASRSRAAFPRAFPDEDAARAFLHQVILPPSLRWGFLSVGKNASSSTLAALFRAEFGTDLSVDVIPESDINPEAALHMLADHRVFGRASHLGMAANDMTGPTGPAERICIVRDPVARAASAFRYLCVSHAKRSRWFAGDRFRLNASLGFDWSRHPGTQTGFRLFLRYIEAEIALVGVDKVDAHWRPQVDFIKPEVFCPTLIGRMEALPVFFADLSARLQVPQIEPPWKNRQSRDDAAFTGDPEARKLCARIYAGDYEAYGY